MVDFDYVRDPKTGKIEDWALAVIRELNSFTEISPSETGIHVHVNFDWKLEYSKSRFKNNRPGGKTEIVRGETKHEGIEIHGRAKTGEGQYFTVSGNHLEGTPLTVESRDLSSLIERVQNLSVFGTPKSEAPKNEKPAGTFVIPAAEENDDNSKREAGWIRTIIDKVKVGNQVDSYRVERMFRHDYATGTPGHKHRPDPQKWDDKRNHNGESVTWLRYSILNVMKLVGVTELTETVVEEWTPKVLAGDLPAIGRCTTKVLPFCCRDAAVDLHERMSVPLELPAMALIVGLAGVSGRKVMVQPKEFDSTWMEALNLWGAIIAPPSTLKSPVMSAVLSPVTEVEKEWGENFAEEKRVYKIALAEYEEKAAKAKRKNESFTEKPPVSPVRRRLLSNDATHQKLHETMSDNPGGILLHYDELSGWLRQLDMKGREGSRSFHLQAWNGRDWRLEETISRGVIGAYVCESLCGNFQPDTARDYLQNQDKGDGLFQRLQILLYPDTVAYPRVDRLPNFIAMNLVKKVMTFIAKLPVSNTPVPGVVLRFNAAAQVRANAWFDDLLLKLADEKDSRKAEHLGKYRGLMPTLAAIYQLADIVANLPSEAKPENFRGNLDVDLEHTQIAIDMCALLESHLTRIYSFRQNPALHAALKLSEHILAGDLKAEITESGGFTVRDVVRHEFSGLTTSDIVRAALDELEDRNWVRGDVVKSGKNGGRPLTLWVVNPKVFEVPDTDLSDI